MSTEDEKKKEHTMRWVIVDESTAVGNEAAYGGPISEADGKKIAAAEEVQLNRDLSTFWGGSYAVRWGASKTDVQKGEGVAALLDELPNAPGAVAYHDVEGNEVPVIFLARTQCRSIMTGSDSVSGALSHELCEAAVDPFCNAWRDDGKGHEWAQEACDAVQEAGYEIDGVAVSDFLLPVFFAAGSLGPYDFLGVNGAGAVEAPFQTMSGGYQLRRSSGGGETSVDGMIGDARMARKRHFSSRTYRRGARV